MMVNSMKTFRVLIGPGCKQYDDVSVIIDEPNDYPVSSSSSINDNIRTTTPKISILPTLTVAPGGFIVNFLPKLTGTYQIRVLLNSINIPGSPYSIEVLPLPILPMITDEDYQILFDQQQEQTKQINAYGQGLGPVCYVNQLCQFVVDLKQVRSYDIEGNSSSSSSAPCITRIKVIVEGPSHAAIYCKDNGDRSCSIAYIPTKIGIYYISVLYNMYHLPQSPYRVEIIQERDKFQSYDDVMKSTTINRKLYHHQRQPQRSKSFNSSIQQRNILY